MEILSIWTYRSYIIGRFKPTDWVVIKDWIGRFKPIDYIRSISEIDKMSIFSRSKKPIDYKHVDTAESVGIQPIDYDDIWCKKERKTYSTLEIHLWWAICYLYTECKRWLGIHHQRWVISAVFIAVGECPICRRFTRSLVDPLHGFCLTLVSPCLLW